MIVLSLFDGCSCGQVALHRLGISVNRYYASEINDNSIKITQRNYPNTIQIGDVLLLSSCNLKRLGKIDLLMGGSPCEDLSINRSDRKNIYAGLQGEKSSLFYKFVEILNIVKPKYFLFENVESMTGNNRNIISSLLGGDPLLIDSSLVSAQDRKRYYWTNIFGIDQPKDRGILLKDVMETCVSEKYYYDRPFEFYGLDNKVCAMLKINSHDMLKRVYSPNFKCATLTTVHYYINRPSITTSTIPCRVVYPLSIIIR